MESISCLRGHCGVGRKAGEHVNVSAVLSANRHWHSHSRSTPLPVTPHLVVDGHLMELRICLELPAADRQLAGLPVKTLERDSFSQRLSETPEPKREPILPRQIKKLAALLPIVERDYCLCLFP